MEYRQDIDGLRAVAVLPVIFFHAGFELFQGGFLGVDVFFVISGFLITSIILSELHNKKFSIVKFYERRARRIMPALSLVLMCTYVAGLVFIPPFEFKELAQSLVSVVAFFSNIFFYLEIDYFSLAAEEMPLLHTWSLAIEEQYYIMFPPLVCAIWRLGFLKVLWIFVGLVVLSVLSMLFLNSIGDSSASFFWPISRAWELLAGSICALLAWQYKIKERKYWADIGLIVLVACFILWSSKLAHPGILTFIPVVATCLIVLFPNKQSMSYRILVNKQLVLIGLLSYSLYLWHQPIFAFLRIKSVGQPSLDLIVAALVFTFIMAYISYRYVETPFRKTAGYSRGFIFSASFMVLCVFFSMGLYGHFSDGVQGRFINVKSYADSMRYSPKREACHASSSNYLSPEDACSYFGANVEWAVFGDSHIVEPAFALANILETREIGISHHSYSGCPPALNYQVTINESCRKWYIDTLRYLENEDSIQNIMIGFRYSSAIYGDNTKFFPDVPDGVSLEIVSGKDYSEDEKLELYWQSLLEIVERLLAVGKRVVLLEPIPELPTHMGRATTAFSVFGDSTLLDLSVATTKDYYEKRHEFILGKLRGLKGRRNLTLVNVYDLLCHDQGCPATLEGVALYFDDDHLSIEGSRILLEQMSARLVALL